MLHIYIDEYVFCTAAVAMEWPPCVCGMCHVAVACAHTVYSQNTY